MPSLYILSPFQLCCSKNCVTSAYELSIVPLRVGRWSRVNRTTLNSYFQYILTKIYYSCTDFLRVRQSTKIRSPTLQKISRETHFYFWSNIFELGPKVNSIYSVLHMHLTDIRLHVTHELKKRSTTLPKV